MESKLSGRLMISDKVVQERLDELVYMLEALNSDDLEHNKVLEFIELFGNTDKFRRYYNEILPNIKANPKFLGYDTKIGEVSTKIRQLQKRGIFADVRYFLDHEQLFENYDYAKFVIETFNSSSLIPYPKAFFDYMGIDAAIFKLCVRTVEEFDVDLFREYQEKCNSSVEIRLGQCISNLNSIVNGINTGKLDNGVDFDILEFWRLVPFKYLTGIKREFEEYQTINPKLVIGSKYFIDYIDNFMKVFMPDERAVVVGYLVRNGIEKFTTLITEDDFKDMYSGLTIRRQKKQEDGSFCVETFCFDGEDLDNVVRYVRASNLPPILEVYKVVQQRYIDGEITNEVIRDIENRNGKVLCKTLIPKKKES